MEKHQEVNIQMLPRILCSSVGLRFEAGLLLFITGSRVTRSFVKCPEFRLSFQPNALPEFDPKVSDNENSELGTQRGR